ncbi:MAG TPA: hypothetical protein VFS62_15150, partial [Chloroflexota bacterium]|nr:hypothetical protein [Chloroflexota bacterium]
MTPRLARWLPGLALIAALIAPLSAHAQPLPLETPPAGLPAHFALGIAAEPDDSGLYGWLPNSGVPWDYAYQYLAGGVNTGSGWATWNDRAQFPLWYAQGAAKDHAIPVFSYYMLLQSNGPCGSCDEGQKDLAHLNDPGVMAAYYRDFALLMERLGSATVDGVPGFGGTAIVHVEPDLSGYAMQAALDSSHCYGFCTASGNDPAVVKASVGSSGFGPIAAYPNTYQGFNWALLHLRDLYAPNVKLAFHVSDWATLRDVGSDPDPGLNAGILGMQAGKFAALSGAANVPAGATTYD